MTFSGDMLCLKRKFKQEGNRPIVFEAEKASLIKLRNRDERIANDENASGGSYIQYASQLEYDYVVETPGRYHVRFLAYFPLKGTWMHHERMDEGDVKGVFDSQNGDVKTWLWTKGETYDLSKGEHRYIFPSPTAFCGGAKLDKIVLEPVEQQIELSGKGPASSPQIGENQGSATTKRVNLSRIKEWKLLFDAIKNDGRVQAEYSYDRKNWKRLVSDQTMTPPTPKPDYLWIRFKLQATSGKRIPYVAGLKFSILLDKTVRKKGEKRYVKIN